MLTAFINSINEHFSAQFQIAFMIVTAIVSTYIFWRSALRSYKKPHKLFDLAIVSVFCGLVISRVLVILTSPELFVSARWFWLPYEKINDVVYIMASFPWLFFNTTVGGIFVDGFLLGMLASFFIFSKSLKIKWNLISDAVSDFMWSAFWFASIFFLIKVTDANRFATLLALTTVGLIHFALKHWKVRLPSAINGLIDLIWKILALVVPAFLLLLTAGSRIHSNEAAQILIVVDVLSIIVGLMMVITDKFSAVAKKDENAQSSHDSKLSETATRHRFSISYKDIRGNSAVSINRILPFKKKGPMPDGK